MTAEEFFKTRMKGEPLDDDFVIDMLIEFGEMVVDLCLEKAEVDLDVTYRGCTISDTSILNVKDLIQFG